MSHLECIEGPWALLGHAPHLVLAVVVGVVTAWLQLGPAALDKLAKALMIGRFLYGGV